MQRLFGITIRWGFSYILRLSDVFHFEKPKTSHDVILRVFNETKAREEAKALLQLVPDRAYDGRRRRKTNP